MFVCRRSVVILVLLSPTMILALSSGRMSPLKKSLIAPKEMLGQRNGQGTTTIPHFPSMYLICQVKRLHVPDMNRRRECKGREEILIMINTHVDNDNQLFLDTDIMLRRCFCV